MTKALALVNGIPRMIETEVSIYEEIITVVASGASGDNEMNGPISSGTIVFLPNSKTYSSDELEVYLEESRLTKLLDYTNSSSTSVQFTFQIKVGERIKFRIDRGE